MRTIYTIGTQGMKLERLVEVMRGLGALLVDVRSQPYSWNADFNRPSLEAAVQGRYVWKGRDLGGRSAIKQSGIQWIRAQRERTSLVLLCMERAPWECHRHLTICGPHFGDAVHIYGDELIRASELEDGGTYEVFGSLNELLRMRAER